MVIRAIQLTNFRRFRSAFVEFPDNLIGILGRNGAGKTTLVEAIYWALYGRSALQGLGRGRQENESLRWIGAGEEESCRVELWFELGGEQYRVIREIRGKSAALRAQLYREGGGSKPIAERDSGVAKYLENLIGLDARSFRASVFARQRELAAFSDLQPEQRKQTVHRLVGIDLIDRARLAVRERRSQEERYAEGLEKGLEDVDELRSRLAEAEEHRDESKAAADAAREALDEVRALEEAKRAAHEEQQNRRAEYLQAKANVEKIETSLKHSEEQRSELVEQIGQAETAQKEVERLQPLLSKLPEIRREKERLDETEAERRRLPDLRAEFENAQSQIEENEAKLGEVQQKIRELQAEHGELLPEVQQIAELEKRRQELEREQRKLHGELQSLGDRGKDLRAKRQQILDLGSDTPCPVCRRPLGEHQHQVLAEFDRELEKLRARYAELRKQLKRVELDKREAEGQLDALRAKERRLSALEAELEARRREEASLREAMDALAAKAKQLEETLARIEAAEYDAARHAWLKEEFERLLELQKKAERYSAVAERLSELRTKREQLERNIAELRTQLAQAQQALEKIAFREEEFERAEREYREASLERERRQEEWSSRQAEYRASLREITDLRERLRKAEQTQAVLNSVRTTIADLRVLDELLAQFRIELGGRLRPLLEHRTSELVRRTTNGRYALVSLGQDYDLQLYDDNIPYPLNRFSGGEQDLVNLCFRVAISQVVAERSARNPVRFIVLDEVFGSQDEERRHQILEALNGLSHHFRQIFLITHIESVRDMLPAVLEVVEKGPRESEVVVR